MNRFLTSVTIIVAILVGLVFLFGIRAGHEIDASFSTRLDYSPEYLFDFISDISKYPDRKKDIQSLEILERQGQKVIKWRENYNNETWREYEISSQIYPTSFTIDLINSSNGHTAVISYELKEDNRFTELHLTEKGKLESTFRRGLRVIAGDESFLEQEIKWLRVAIQNEQINRP